MPGPPVAFNFPLAIKQLFAVPAPHPFNYGPRRLILIGHQTGDSRRRGKNIGYILRVPLRRIFTDREPGHWRPLWRGRRALLPPPDAHLLAGH
jgi:hypothetical protein